MFKKDRVQTAYEFSKSKKTVNRRVTLSGKRTSMVSLPVTQSKSLLPNAAFDYEYLRIKNNKSTPNGGDRVRIADLFSGCGGLSLGVREACEALGFHFVPVIAMDNDDDCVSVYNSNFGDVARKCDIQDIIDGKIGNPLSESEEKLARELGHIDILLAGPPCQGNSDLNNHTRRNDSRNNLYLSVARFVEIIRPSSVIIENVPTVIHGKEKATQKTIKALSKLNYNVDSASASMVDIGVPQKRKRHFVVASSLDVPNIQTIMEKYKVEKPRVTWWAISDLETEPENGILTKPTKHSPLNLQRMKYLQEHDIYDLPDEYRPPCHQDSKHSYKSMYGRLRKNDPAQTITSGFVSPGQGRFIHPTQLRTLTPHEAARIQFFPDFFDFSKAKTRSSLASMIGNAVPMKMGFILALEILSSTG